MIRALIAASVLAGVAIGGGPQPIAGGPFEASGVAYVPGSEGVLFVDDGRTREIFWMELTSDGAQRGRTVSIPLPADITDLEGITGDGARFYVVGSQSKRTGFTGDGLARFRFDAKTQRISDMERIGDLKGWLADHVAELRGTGRRIGDEVLNIEAIAWDPKGERLLLGLRAPVVDGQALIVPVKLRDASGAFSRDNLMLDGATIRLPLGGAGIRSLEYDTRIDRFHLITGAMPDAETRDFRLLEWDGRSGATSLRELSRFPRTLKPEGITQATIAGRDVSVLVFDVGSFVVRE